MRTLLDYLRQAEETMMRYGGIPSRILVSAAGGVAKKYYNAKTPYLLLPKEMREKIKFRLHERFNVKKEDHSILYYPDPHGWFFVIKKGRSYYIRFPELLENRTKVIIEIISAKEKIFRVYY